jgi:hypothetical protein
MKQDGKNRSVREKITSTGFAFNRCVKGVTKEATTIRRPAPGSPRDPRKRVSLGGPPGRISVGVDLIVTAGESGIL